MHTPDTQSVDPETLARLPEFYHPVVSPDGSQVAFYYDEHGRNDLYLFDRERGSYEQVTDGEAPRSARWHVQWSRDGSGVYFHQDDAGDEQNDLVRVTADGTVEPIVSVDGQAIFMDTTMDGQTVLYGSDEGEQMNLYRYDTARDERQQLTAYEHPVMYGAFSPDDDRIAYATNESDALENRDAYVMAADGSEKRRLDIGEDGSESTVSGWFPDGERVLVSDNAADLRRVGIYALATDEIEWLGLHEAEEAPAAISPDGRYVLVSRQRRGATMPVVYDLETDEATELAVAEGVASIPGGRTSAFVDDSTLVFSHSRPDARKELYEYDLETHEYEVLLEATYGDVDPDAFVDAEYVTYESEDGLEIGGLLYDPRDGPVRAGDETAVPGVVHVHGGPHARSSKAFGLMAQFLVSRGYAVFQPNYRGSTGRGRAFKQAILGDWGGMEQADVAAGGRWLMDQDWIDADRVAVYGGSYGGYSVYSQLTRYPTLWTTGIASVGITDLHRLYEEDMPHFQYMLRQQMGDPEENHELWRDRSPIEHVDEIERPIYMIHGVNDPRCPIEQARIFRDALEERGWTEGTDYEYTELGEEGHGSTDIEQKVRKFDLLGDYLHRQL
ncbi:dipeptidyl aminopeptidase/acylaminoacyl peptidase [Halovivax ruber XH-70]|uniref:Dipeptidyl aminopeptidase/acylaminoacyl peptidase n=1 Tax=Halovivax ruber (strain DSM 18193 / JCM 13892 / XH-70) TaxID=797302 RepID=L0I915_HALRX|nr:S9 family peptidase [Halovivax ruber]AGB15204.1 dipeptidyl aminopeptidase/acylaminoacyl peptidase [Halovivax ruber XH-70]